MRLIALIIIFGPLSLPARALETYTSTSHSCSGLKSIIEQKNAIYIRYPSPRGSGVMLCGRFVSSANFCESAKRAMPVPVRARDNKACRIRISREQIDDNFN